MDPVFEKLEQTAVVAVVMIDDERKAVPLARALVAGGITAMELTLRTEAALRSIKEIVKEVPEMLVGAGTVLTPDQVKEVQNAGAGFAVAPGTNKRVIEAARAADIPFAPGIATPSDIENALALDCRVLKLFPANGMGGLPYLKNIAAPYRHLGLRYIPLGGVTEGNLAEYVRDPDVLAVGGSWLAPPSLLAHEDWKAIEALAASASAEAKRVRAEDDATNVD